MSSNLPIGVFDSGVGGLSVLKFIRQQLPNEDLLYVADNAFAPYGKRPLKEIQDRCIAITEFLLEQGAKAIVVACNTATAAAVEKLRDNFDIPIIGMEPGLKPAIAHTTSKVVAILATDNTLTSQRFESLIDRYNNDTTLIIQPCTEWVELIEKGDFDSPEIEKSLSAIIPPLLEKNVDTIVLGCSHYPLIIKQIEKHTHQSARVIDTGEAVAREVKRRISEIGQCNQNHVGTEKIWSSSTSNQTIALIQKIWTGVENIELLNI